MMCVRVLWGGRKAESVHSVSQYSYQVKSFLLEGHAWGGGSCTDEI